MSFLSTAEKDRIAEAIRRAETATSGEIVTVIARSSDAYLFIPLLWASVAALTVPVIALSIDPWMSPVILYVIQLLVFAALALVFRWAPVKMRLVPRGVKRRRAGRLAREQFLVQGLHRTEGRGGVLLFVSVAERHVEVLADSGIDEKAPPGTWDSVVGALIGRVRQGRVGDGFVEAVDTLGALLAEHFPAPAGGRNELPNHLVEI